MSKQLTADEIMDLCNCSRPEMLTVADHAGTCPVWAKHHNLSTDRPVVLRTFENIIHVALTHSNDRLDSRGVKNVITAKAREWAREHGFTSVSCVSGGWTLGKDESETRLIFLCK